MSEDGGITEKEYRQVLQSGKLDFIAITDHNTITFAQKLRKKIGEKIIVGEEISAKEGEIIGLFLSGPVSPGLSFKKTVQEIHKQGGIVYIPHPFDILRKGVGEKVLLANISNIDILEGFNARMILGRYNTKAQIFAREHKLPLGVGSDAHTILGLGRAYAIVEKPYTKKQACILLHSAYFHMQYQPLSAFLAPKLNRIKQKFEGR